MDGKRDERSDVTFNVNFCSYPRSLPPGGNRPLPQASGTRAALLVRMRHLKTETGILIARIGPCWRGINDDVKEQEGLITNLLA